MILTGHILIVPFLILLWAADTLLFIVALRLVLDRFGGPRTASLQRGLREMTEPFRVVADRWITRARGRPWPEWAVWVLVITGILLVREFIMRMVLALS